MSNPRFIEFECTWFEKTPCAGPATVNTEKITTVVCSSYSTQCYVALTSGEKLSVHTTVGRELQERLMKF